MTQKILILAILASAVPLYAIVEQWHVVRITALAEDDCPYFYEGRAIVSVNRNGDHVNCDY